MFAPCWTTLAPASRSLVIMIGLVDDGTATVHGWPRVLDALATASPALPADGMKKCRCLPAFAGSVACERTRFPTALWNELVWIFFAKVHGTAETYRDLKEPLGWRFSSFKNTRLWFVSADVLKGEGSYLPGRELTSRQSGKEPSTRSGVFPPTASLASSAPGGPQSCPFLLQKKKSSSRTDKKMTLNITVRIGMVFD